MHWRYFGLFVAFVIAALTVLNGTRATNGALPTATIDVAELTAQASSNLPVTVVADFI